MNMDVEDDAQQRKVVFARVAYSRQVFEASMVRLVKWEGGKEGRGRGRGRNASGKEGGEGGRKARAGNR